MKVISFLAICLIAILSRTTLAQTHESIELIDGTIIIDNIEYSDITGILFHLTESGRNRINVDSVKRFEVFEEEKKQLRIFEVLSYRGKSGRTHERLFEILKETNTSSLACLQEPVNINIYTRAVPKGSTDMQPILGGEVRPKRHNRKLFTFGTIAAHSTHTCRSNTT